MEVTALCIRLLTIVLLLLVGHVQQSHPQTSVADAAFRVVPTRLQLFEYESVRFTCEGFNVSAGWKVRNIKEFIPQCSNGTVTSTVTCTIDYAFVSDSGEYWCEGGGGKKSNTVNITVTAGSVILKSPVLPVMEGDAVTLSCRNKTSSTNLAAGFYRDGVLIGNSSTGNMTFRGVSKSHEGLYKCSISGAGESPESWLAVKVEMPKYNVSEKESEDSNTQLAERSASDKINFSRHYYILLWIVVSIILVLQLLVIGLLYWKKQLVLLEAKLNYLNFDEYAVVKKGKKKKDAAHAADNLSLCLDTNHSTKPQTEEDNDEYMSESFHSTFTVDDPSQAPQNESGVSSFAVTAAPSAATDSPSTDEDPQYASIHEFTEEETLD